MSAIFACEGGLQSPESNINELTRDFGITIEKTTLVRATYHKYLHPKEALIQNGIVQPEIGAEKFTPLNNTNRRRQQEQNTTTQDAGIDPSMSLSFVYPNGTTLSVQSPAYTLLTSGSTSYPVDCPIAATWESDNVSGKQGRVLVLGSSDIFADDWLDKEENSQLCDVLFRAFPTYHHSVPWSSRASKRMIRFHRTTEAFYAMICLVFTMIMCPMSSICTNN